MSRKSLKFDFPNGRGETLSGRLEMPDGEPEFFGVFAHCYTCNKDVHAAARISKALAERGVAMLRFDMTGMGESEGDFSDTNLSTNTADVVAAAKALAEKHEAPVLLVGHSFGGLAAQEAAEQLDEVELVAVIGTPKDADHVTRHMQHAKDVITEKGEAEVNIAGRKFTIKKQFVDDIDAHDMERVTQALECALHVFHAPNDDMVSFKNAEGTYKRARDAKNKPDVKLHKLDGAADHLLTRREDSEAIADEIAGWLKRHGKKTPKP